MAILYSASLGVIESPIGHVPITTQTFDRIRLCFRMKVRFSDAFLASHRINQRQRLQQYTCCCSWHVWYGVEVLRASVFISEFIWVNVRWNKPTWQACTCSVVYDKQNNSVKKVINFSKIVSTFFTFFMCYLAIWLFGYMVIWYKNVKPNNHGYFAPKSEA